MSACWLWFVVAEYSRKWNQENVLFELYIWKLKVFAKAKMLNFIMKFLWDVFHKLWILYEWHQKDKNLKMAGSDIYNLQGDVGKMLTPKAKVSWAVTDETNIRSDTKNGKSLDNYVLTENIYMAGMATQSMGSKSMYLLVERTRGNQIASNLQR